MKKYVLLNLIFCICNNYSLLNGTQNSPIDPPIVRVLDPLENREDIDLKKKVYTFLSTVAPSSYQCNPCTQEAFHKLNRSYQNLEERNKQWTPRKKYILSMLPVGMNIYLIDGHMYFFGSIETQQDVKFKNAVRYFLRTAKLDPFIQQYYADEYKGLKISYQDKKMRDSSWVPTKKTLLALVISVVSFCYCLNNKKESGTIKKNQ